MKDINMPLDTIISLKDCTIYQQDHLVLGNVNLDIHRASLYTT
ncbi:MAG: hypothetical protein R2744_01925 [Bacteroidales bacterium]